MDNKILGSCIRFHRQKIGLTQAELAEKVAVSENLIGYYERGVAAPGRETLFKLSVVLDFSIDALVRGGEYAQGAAFPDEITKLLDQLSPSQRRIALTSLKAMVEAMLDKRNGEQQNSTKGR